MRHQKQATQRLPQIHPPRQAAAFCNTIVAPAHALIRMVVSNRGRQGAPSSAYDLLPDRAAPRRHSAATSDETTKASKREANPHTVVGQWGSGGAVSQSDSSESARTRGASALIHLRCFRQKRSQPVAFLVCDVHDAVHHPLSRCDFSFAGDVLPETGISPLISVTCQHSIRAFQPKDCRLKEIMFMRKKAFPRCNRPISQIHAAILHK